jgi:hypothetical protein
MKNATEEVQNIVEEYNQDIIEYLDSDIDPELYMTDITYKLNEMKREILEVVNQ